MPGGNVIFEKWRETQKKFDLSFAQVKNHLPRFGSRPGSDAVIQCREPKTGQHKVQHYYKDDPLCPSSYIIYLCQWVSIVHSSHVLYCRVQTWMFETKEKGLFSLYVYFLFLNVLKMFFFIQKIPSFYPHVIRSDLLFSNKTCRFLKTPRFRNLRTWV